MIAPSFSVIIPAFNRREFLERTLPSVRAQSYTDYEVIVVDDGSTDGTREWLASQSGRVRVLTQSNRGAGAARNLGVRHANGRYLAFLDSDDVWFPWTLSAYAQVVEEQDEPSFLTGTPFIFTASEQLPQVTPGEVQVEIFADYYASADAWRWFSASSFVIRRDRLVAAGGFHEEWGSEDSDLAMMLGVEKGFVHITAPPTFGYREHRKSLKTMPTYSLSGSRLMVEKEKNGLYPGGRSRKRNRREILTRQMRPVALECLRAGLRKEGWQLYCAAALWHIELGRWKFLAAFPVLTLLALFHRNSDHPMFQKSNAP